MVLTSARSCGLPEASSSLEIKNAVRPLSGSTVPSTRRVEIDARKVGEDVEALWVASKTKEGVAIGEVLRTNALQWGAELSESTVGRLSVGRIGFDEKVDVLRKTGLCVKHHRVTAND
jgi:hypothetical protein